MYTKKNGRMTYKSNRRPNFKRNNNYSSKGRNKGNVTQQYNKYLKLAKDTFTAGDRIQAEYYFQFTDHYYRLMIELGINLEEQENSIDAKDENLDNPISENNNESSLDRDEKSYVAKTKVDEEDVVESIESVPFITEPIKKKRTRTSK